MGEDDASELENLCDTRVDLPVCLREINTIKSTNYFEVVDPAKRRFLSFILRPLI